MRRYSPSARLTRCWLTNGWPVRVASAQSSAARARSSGWMASAGPRSRISASVWPVKAHQPGWSSANVPSGALVHTMAAVASTSVR